MRISGGGQPSLSSPTGFRANEKSPLKVKITLRNLLINIQKVLRIDVFPKPLKHQATLSRHSEQSVVEIYKDKHGVRRISCGLRFFALCKDLLGWCKSCAQNDVVALEKGTSYGAVSVDNRNCAFTLAEVLITLGIIGIVAAMTLPTVITKYQKKVTVNRFKQSYSILYQAIERSEVDNGDTTGWDFDNLSGVEVFEKYLKPYIKGISKDHLSQNGAKGITYKQISGVPETGLRLMGNGTSSEIYSLPNGTQLFFDNNHPTGLTTSIRRIGLAIDINGFAPPNQFGKDLFYLYLSSEHKLYPMGVYSTSECQFPSDPNHDRNVLKNSSCLGYACNKQSRGMWCGALIMIDGWEIKDDYPW